MYQRFENGNSWLLQLQPAYPSFRQRSTILQLDYVDLLKAHHIKISMTENGDPLENAIAERVNGILKEELLEQKYTDFKTAQQDVGKAIVIYNELRPHSSCNMLTPQRAHLQTGILKKHWKNYYTKKEVSMAEP